jgi:hypothetical protein
MKLVIKQIDWWGLKTPGKKETTLEYGEDMLASGSPIVVADVEIERLVVKKNIFGKVKDSQRVRSTEIIFCFEVVNRGDGEIVLKINGTAGGEWNKNKQKYEPQIVTLKKNEMQKFSTKTMDSGKSFEITYTD